MMDYIWFWIARQIAELMFVIVFFPALFIIPMGYWAIVGLRRKK